jgi:hypothetical protein
MILVNHRVVVTQEEWNLLALGAEPHPTGNFMHDEAWMHITSLPVFIAPDDGTPIDCGDGWLACYKFDALYAWNDGELKANLERAVQESIGAFAADNGMEGRSVGLFQQATRDYYAYTSRAPRDFLGGLSS